MSETRKLTTILALDMVGYSRAAGQDESAAADAVRALRELITKTAAPRDGRLLSSAGDGFMLELPMASAALEAATELADQLASASSPLLVRVGIHLGEVIAEANGDLHGHGVNRAARLQQ